MFNCVVDTYEDKGIYDWLEGERCHNNIYDDIMNDQMHNMEMNPIHVKHYSK